MYSRTTTKVIQVNVGDTVEIHWVHPDNTVTVEIRTASSSEPKMKTVMRNTEKM